MAASYREAFLDGAEQYDRVTSSRHIRLIYELECAVLEGLFEDVDSRSKSVMDFACGSGRWTGFLAERFGRTVGVDISAAMVDIARKKCPGVEFAVADITGEGDPLGGRTFDVVTAFRFFKNAEQPLRLDAARAVNRHLEPGGLFIFDLHLNTFSFMGLLAVAMRSLRIERALGAGTLTVRTISLRTVRKILRSSGFEIVDYYGTGLLPGRSNYTVLPYAALKKIETAVTMRKLLRPIAYNLLIVARKKSDC